MTGGAEKELILGIGAVFSTNGIVRAQAEASRRTLEQGPDAFSHAAKAAQRSLAAGRRCVDENREAVRLARAASVNALLEGGERVAALEREF